MFFCSQLTDLNVSALYLAAEMNHTNVVRELVLWYANPSAHHMSIASHCCRLYRDAHPHFELEPLQAAMKNDNFATMKLILAATPRMPYRILTILRDLVLRTAYAREARLDDATMANYQQFFTSAMSLPRSLQDECCGVIRLALDYRQLSYRVGQLNLPFDLKQRILMNRIMAELCDNFNECL